MQRSAWSRFSFGRGGISRLSVIALLALLAGCEGSVTMDLATALPANPNITEVVANIRGLEFSTGSGSKTLEFSSSEQVNLIILAENNGVLRLFTDEQLSEGNYTGVRLLFDENRPNETFVSTAAGTRFPLNLANGDFAALRFNVEDNERSTDSFTLVLDLRKSLSFDIGSAQYTLTPSMHTVETARASSIEGTVSGTCPAGQSLARGAVYLFQGRDVTPDDIDGTGVEPFATSPVFTSGNSFFYTLSFLPAGDYTLAVTCIGNDDNPTTDEDLQFRNVVNVRLGESETLTRNLP
ncbi:DUF4382 domain-containing protein [Steroidobacter cummioxidans]|uniref:DUF4382 domain-containing protein n=1 Tax=Steroidobacter cummioxidans TaxID=1803913 RepID=UPI00137A348C|nr:DUF4382 domain-containing protein [Steroidobacter cummioxidans]